MNVNLEKVTEIMEERGITTDDVNAVVSWAESEGVKLTDDDRNLAKKRLDKVMVYVEYMTDGTVEDVYSHRVTLGEEA